MIDDKSILTTLLTSTYGWLVFSHLLIWETGWALEAGECNSSVAFACKVCTQMHVFSKRCSVLLTSSAKLFHAAGRFVFANLQASCTSSPKLVCWYLNNPAKRQVTENPYHIPFFWLVLKCSNAYMKRSCVQTLHWLVPLWCRTNHFLSEMNTNL